MTTVVSESIKVTLARAGWLQIYHLGVVSVLCESSPNMLTQVAGPSIDLFPVKVQLDNKRADIVDTMADYILNFCKEEKKPHLSHKNESEEGSATPKEKTHQTASWESFSHKPAATHEGTSISHGSISVSPLYFSTSDIHPSEFVSPLWALRPPSRDQLLWLLQLGNRDAHRFLNDQKYQLSETETMSDTGRETWRPSTVAAKEHSQPSPPTSSNYFRGLLYFLYTAIFATVLAVFIRPMAVCFIYSELLLCLGIMCSRSATHLLWTIFRHPIISVTKATNAVWAMACYMLLELREQIETCCLKIYELRHISARPTRPLNNDFENRQTKSRELFSPAIMSISPLLVVRLAMNKHNKNATDDKLLRRLSLVYRVLRPLLFINGTNSQIVMNSGAEKPCDAQPQLIIPSPIDENTSSTCSDENKGECDDENIPIADMTANSFEAISEDESDHELSIKQSIAASLAHALSDNANDDEKLEEIKSISIALAELKAYDTPLEESLQTEIIELLATCVVSVTSTELQLLAHQAVLDLVEDHEGADDDNLLLQTIVEQNIPVHWVQQLTQPALTEQAALSLGVLSSKSAAFRKSAMEAGAVAELQAMLDASDLKQHDAPFCFNETSVSSLKNAVFALCSLCAGPALDDHQCTINAAIPSIVRLTRHVTLDIASEALWSLAEICKSTTDGTQTVIDSGAVPILVTLLSEMENKDPDILQPAVRTLAFICGGSVEQAQAALHGGCIIYFADLLSRNQPLSVRHEAALALANLAAGDSTQVSAIFEANLVPPLINAMADVDSELQHQAVFACFNLAVNGEEAQVAILVKAGAIEALVQVLESEVEDNGTLAITLEAVSVFLEWGESMTNDNETSNQCLDRFRATGGAAAIEALTVSEGILVVLKKGIMNYLL